MSDLFEQLCVQNTILSRINKHMLDPRSCPNRDYRVIRQASLDAFEDLAGVFIR